MRLRPAKLTLEDFQAQKDWIGPLFQVLNGFTEDIVTAFANRLSVEDNLQQEIREIKWINSTTNYPLKFKAKLGTNPQGMTFIYLFNNTLGEYSTQTPTVVWSYESGIISISNISGLTSASTYTIRLLVIYG